MKYKNRIATGNLATFGDLRRQKIVSELIDRQRRILEVIQSGDYHEVSDACQELWRQFLSPQKKGNGFEILPETGILNPEIEELVVRIGASRNIYGHCAELVKHIRKMIALAKRSSFQEKAAPQPQQKQEASSFYRALHRVMDADLRKIEAALLKAIAIRKRQVLLQKCVELVPLWGAYEGWSELPGFEEGCPETGILSPGLKELILKFYLKFQEKDGCCVCHAKILEKIIKVGK